MSKPLHYDVAGKLCILSVDDDAVNLMVMEQLLAPQGWRVVSAQDGEDALEVLEGMEAWPDLVFLDYHMAGGPSGDEVCKTMRGMFGSQAIPICMCTALGADSHDQIEACKQAGSSDVLLKPFERIKVLDMIHKHCGHKAVTTAKQEGACDSTSTPRQAEQPAASPAPQGSMAQAPSTTCAEDLHQFCTNLGLEYCGKKLAAAGLSLEQVLLMDDRALRQAGVVVQGQRDKIMQAACQLRPGKAWMV